MAGTLFHNDLLQRLPAVRGRYRENAPLGESSWFRTGGVAEIYYRPADREDLIAFLAARPGNVPLTMVGAMSNILVREGGVPGVVIKLGREFAHIHVENEDITVGAGALDYSVAQASLAASLSGLEFLIGIPGTIGGALRMNAGAYGREMKDITQRAQAVDLQGRVHEMDNAALGFSYRACGVDSSWIFLEAQLRGDKGDRDMIAERMDAIRRERDESQPVRTPTGGSTFANPPGRKAWELIEAAGCRGLQIGGAMISEKHCNFMINTGNATARDLEELGETVRRRVLEKSGVTLEWEIRRIGEKAEAAP